MSMPRAASFSWHIKYIYPIGSLWERTCLVLIRPRDLDAACSRDDAVAKAWVDRQHTLFSGHKVAQHHKRAT
eukprot:220210-Amphidinium_carterae.1